MSPTLPHRVDLWFNIAQPPLEASETSGMKAALDGVLRLSFFERLVARGCIEGFTDWAISSSGRGTRPATPLNRSTAS
jgi:hypothetical protein